MGLVKEVKKHYLTEMLTCAFCHGDLGIYQEVAKKKSGKRTPLFYQCDKCKKIYKDPFRICPSERDLRHKEVLETYKFSMTGILGLIVAIIIANLYSLNVGNEILIKWDYLFFGGLLTILFGYIFFNKLFEEIRREIEILKILEEVKK